MPLTDEEILFAAEGLWGKTHFGDYVKMKVVSIGKNYCVFGFRDGNISQTVSYKKLNLLEYYF